MKKRKRKKLIKLFFKLSLSAFLIMFVMSKVDVEKMSDLVKNANKWYFVAAFFAITIAQIFGAWRMRYNFSATEFKISRLYTTGTYFIGTLFNIILPGGIGGDGWRAFHFHKRFKFPWTKTIVIILRGRASGLFFLMAFLIAFAFFYQNQLQFIPHVREVLIASLILIFPAYSICTRIFLKEPLKTQLGGLKYSFFSQVFFLIGIVCILHGIGNHANIIGYILVFLIANIVAVIPISFGGIGLREFTYITLAGHIGLNSQIGVAASLLYYFIYTATAFIGLAPYFMLRKMDHKELLYQRSLEKNKYAMVVDKDEDMDEEKNDVT